MHVLSLLVVSTSAFRIYNVPVNRTGYETVLTDTRAHLFPGQPSHPHVFTSYGSQVQSDLPQGTVRNGLIEALHLACINHNTLKLSPDIIFFAILQAIVSMDPHQRKPTSSFSPPPNADHVVASRSKAWRKDVLWGRVVTALKDYVEPSYDPEVFDELNVPFSVAWPYVADLFPLFMRSHGPFSASPATTRNVDLTSSAKCEIPEIELEGTGQDWKHLRHKVKTLFSHLSLTDWEQNMEPIIDTFVSARHGVYNVTFWKDIYKRQAARDKSLVSGWINIFFPRRLTKEGLRYNGCFLNNLDYCQGHPLGSYPVMAMDYPFRMEHQGTRFPANVVFGSFGTVWDPEDATIAPAVDWAVFVGQAEPRMPPKNAAEYVTNAYPGYMTRMENIV